MHRIHQKIYNAISKLWRPPAAPYPTLVKLVEAYDAEASGPDVLYLGDSVVERIAREDADRRTLPEMLGDLMVQRQTVLGLSHSAYHPAVYKPLLSCLGRLRHRPRTVIMPINLRCFSPQWDLDPGRQFQPEIRALEAFASGRRKPGAAPRQRRDERQYEQFDRIPLCYPNCPLTSVGEFRRIIKDKATTPDQDELRRRWIFTFFYMNPLSTEHRKLQAIRDAIKLLKRINVRPLLYVTPINFRAAIDLIGTPFDATVSANVNVLSSQLSGEADFHDWSKALDPSFFFHARLHTEHLRESGRAWIAEQLSQVLVNTP